MHQLPETSSLQLNHPAWTINLHVGFGPTWRICSWISFKRYFELGEITPQNSDRPNDLRVGCPEIMILQFHCGGFTPFFWEFPHYFWMGPPDEKKSRITIILLAHVLRTLLVDFGRGIYNSSNGDGAWIFCRIFTNRYIYIHLCMYTTPGCVGLDIERSFTWFSILNAAPAERTLPKHQMAEWEDKALADKVGGIGVFVQADGCYLFYIDLLLSFTM